MANPPLPPATDFPADAALGVKFGAKAFNGYSVAVRMKNMSRAGDVILTARTKEKLAAWFKQITGEEVDMRAVYKTVIMKHSDVQLDDEL